ncbi:hypothetical protein SLS56_008494 [Neofusicoccum ribis]|uniref:Uncharacterized protein n=1 Tax=Neofusicoccum ribis TaxID=45134 RepID=A0ABR3SJX8_9PEZI
MSSSRDHSHSTTPSEHHDTAIEEDHNTSAAISEDASQLAEGEFEVTAFPDDDFGSEDTLYANDSEQLAREHIAKLTKRWNDFQTFMEQWFDRERQRINKLPRHEMVVYVSAVMESKSADDLPQAVCYNIMNHLREFWEITDKEGRNRARRAIDRVLRPLNALNQLPEVDVPITTNLKRLQEGVLLWGDYDVMVTACSLGEQLASVADAASHHAAIWPFEGDDESLDDTKAAFRSAVNLVVDARDAALDLAVALRAPHQSMGLPQDWIDKDHPACLLLLRAHIRRMQGFSQLGAHRVLKDREAVLHQELEQIAGTPLHDDINACLQPGAPLDAASLSRAHETITAASAPACHRSLLVALNSVINQLAAWEAIKSENELTATAHQHRETPEKLHTILSRSTARISRHLRTTTALAPALPPDTERALLAAISNHNHAAALYILHSSANTPLPALPTLRRAFAGIFLDEKSTALLQHLTPNSYAPIACLAASSAARLARLVACGAHAFRTGAACSVTVVTWLCALLDAWFGWLRAMQAVLRGGPRAVRGWGQASIPNSYLPFVNIKSSRMSRSRSTSISSSSSSRSTSPTFSPMWPAAFDPFASDDEEEQPYRPIPPRPGQHQEDEGTSDSDDEEWQSQFGNYYFQEDNNHRLRAFRSLAQEGQMHVIELHLREGLTVIEAIEAVLTLTRRNLMQQPVSAREQHTAAVHLTLVQATNSVFQQWIRLGILVQALPPRIHETGQDILRRASDNPRDIRTLFAARRDAAVRLGISFITGLLDDMSRSAFHFEDADNEFRSLRHYNRRQIPDLDLVGPMPLQIMSPERVLRGEKYVRSGLEGLRLFLRGFKSVMKTQQKLLDPDFFDVDEEFRIIEGNLASPDWENTSTEDPISVMCGAFRACCFGLSGRPKYSDLSRLLDWDQWIVPNPAQQVEKLLHAIDTMCTGVDAFKLVLARILQRDLGRLCNSHPAHDILQAIQRHDWRCVFSLMRERDLSDLPPIVEARLFTYSQMEEAERYLLNLCEELTLLLPKFMGLKQLPHFDDATAKHVVFPVMARGMRRSKLIFLLSQFYPHHVARIDELRELVRSCRNPQASQMMLAALPPSGPGLDLQRVRDVAVAANIEPGIIQSAEDINYQQRDMTDLITFISTVEHAHLLQLTSFPPNTLRAILQGHLPPPATLPRPTSIGAALRLLPPRGRSPAWGTAVRNLSTAALSAATTTALGLLDASSTPDADADADAIARLVLRAWYLWRDGALDTNRDAVRHLSRLCWTVGVVEASAHWHRGLQAVLRWEGTLAGAEAETAALSRHLRKLGALRAVVARLLTAPDVADPRVLPMDVPGLDVGDIWVSGGEEYDALHRMVTFDGCILDGGRLLLNDLDGQP